MFEKISNFFSDLDPKLKTLFKGIGIASAVTLSGSLSYYYFNPLAFSTAFEGLLLGFIPTVLVSGGLTAAFLIKEHFNQKGEVVIPQSELKLNTDIDNTDVEVKPTPTPGAEPKIEEQEHKEVIEAEPTNVIKSDAKSGSESEEVNLLESEVDSKVVEPEETKIEAVVESEPKSILKTTEKIGSSSEELNPKKVQFAESIASEIVLVKVKIEPAEEQPVVFLPQHDVQRAITRQRRAQINIEKNHDAADILPEGSTRRRSGVDRYQ